MKRIFAVLMAFIILIAAVSCGKPTTVIDTDADGNKISESYYQGKTLMRKVLYKNGVEYEVYVYEKSREIERTRYNPDGTVYLRVVREYDKKGNVIKMAEYGNEGCMASHVYSYDKVLLRQDDYDGVGSIVYTAYFDADGQKIKGVTYNEIGEIYEIIEYGYDDAGRLSYAVSKDADGTQHSRIEHIYDGSGNEVRTDTYDGNGDRITSLIMEYDENGKLINSRLE